MTTRISRTWVGCLLLALPLTAYAGAVLDNDGDLVPNEFDNCNAVANGPNQTTNQVDADMDGYGNRCDADCNQDGATTVADFACYFQCFGFPASGVCSNQDYDGNGTVTISDFGIFFNKFSAVGPANAPGPSGLVCANPTIRINLGQAPCMP